MKVSDGCLALLAAGALLAGCSRPVDPQIETALRIYDASYAASRSELARKPELGSAERDFRGRLFEQDLAQWVLAPDTQARLADLRNQAAIAPNLAIAKGHLEEARRLLEGESGRAGEIARYWVGSPPAPYWRRYWNDLFVANEAEVPSPDSMLLGLETRMRDALERGDFKTAAQEAEMLPAVFSEATNRAAGKLIASRRNEAVFAARRTPCPRGAPADRASNKPHLVPTAELESFYPARAERLGEQGTVVLRVKVDRAGCGTQVATVVRSGVPAIDQAALDWFETARFIPAWRSGGPVESDLSFKVRFKMRGP